MLLAQKASSAPCFNFLQKVGCSPEAFNQAVTRISDRMRAASKPLNQEQMKILLNASYSRAGFKPIMGPPGCEKTTLISMLADLYLEAREVGIFVIAGSNGGTDRSFEILDKWMQKDQDLDPRLWLLHVQCRWPRRMPLQS